jgi:hypothetical protein
MLNTPPTEHDGGDEDARIDRIVAAGPTGAIALAGIAAAIVIVLWFAFYLLVFLPRATP